MDIYELHKKINIILDEEVRSYSAKGRVRGGLGSMNVTLQSVPNNGWTNEGQIPQLLFDKSDPTVISSPNATTLIKFYSSLDLDGKSNFKTYLVTHLRKDSPYASIGYLIFFVLYRIGEPVDALKQARLGLLGDTVHGYSNVLGVFSIIISREYLEVDSKTYEDIKLVLQGDSEYKFWLEQKINLALLKHLERDLEDVNPEVNTDRDKVIELWGKKFSSIEVPQIIKEIEDDFRDGDFSDTKFAACIGRIRVLLVEISKRISLSIAQSRSDISITESSDDHHFFQYLKDKKVINDHEWNILRSMYGLASDQGSHSSVSNREYARLIKNITYEMVLLFLSRHGV